MSVSAFNALPTDLCAHIAQFSSGRDGALFCTSKALAQSKVDYVCNHPKSGELISSIYKMGTLDSIRPYQSDQVKKLLLTKVALHDFSEVTVTKVTTGWFRKRTITTVQESLISYATLHQRSVITPDRRAHHTPYHRHSTVKAFGPLVVSSAITRFVPPAYQNPIHSTALQASSSFVNSTTDSQTFIKVLRRLSHFVELFPSVETVDLSGTSIDAIDLRTLAQWKNLTSITFDETTIGDENESGERGERFIATLFTIQSVTHLGLPARLFTIPHLQLTARIISRPALRSLTISTGSRDNNDKVVEEIDKIPDLQRVHVRQLFIAGEANLHTALNSYNLFFRLPSGITTSEVQHLPPIPGFRPNRPRSWI